MDREKIEQALDACYDAVLAPETWSRALHALARSLDAIGCRYRGETGRAILEMPMSPDLREFVTEFGRDGWWRSDHRADRGWPIFKSGLPVLLDHDITTDDDRRRLPLLNELCRRYDLRWWAAVGFAVDGQHSALSLYRDSRRGPFERSEAPGLAGLAPHLARLMRLSDRFALGQVQLQLHVLDQLACAAVLVDWKGTVIRANGGAEAFMGNDLRVCRGMLTAADPRSDRELRALIQQLRTAGPSRGGRPPGRVFIRRDGEGPLVIEALPVAGLAADAFRGARAILIITDLERRLLLPERVLETAFGLTAAEARLASRLGTGESLDGAADALGIAKETARAQLKAVFAKTDTCRQAGLVALLARVSR